MLNSLLVAVLSLGAADGESAIKLSARLSAKELEVDTSYKIQLQLDVPEDFELPQGRRMKHSPILQLAVPSSVRLEGKHLKTYREQSRNEFLEAPFERLIKAGETEIPFVLTSKPQAGDQVSLIVTAFFKSKSSGKEFFLRRRLELPLSPSAVAVDGDPRNSAWGPESKLLKIGDKVEGFSLPLADGSGTWSMKESLGKGEVILTSYRASW